MLVLSRTEGESVILRHAGVEIVVKLVRVDRGKVRLGFQAPRDVVIVRDELDGDTDTKEFSEGLK